MSLDARYDELRNIVAEGNEKVREGWVPFQTGDELPQFAMDEPAQFVMDAMAHMKDAGVLLPTPKPTPNDMKHAKLIFRSGEMTGPLADIIATGRHDWTQIISTGDTRNIYHVEIPGVYAQAKATIRDHFSIPPSVRISLEAEGHEGHVYAYDSPLPNHSSAILVELTHIYWPSDVWAPSIIRHILTFDNCVGAPLKLYANIAQVFKLKEMKDITHHLLQATLPQLVRNPPEFLRLLGFCHHKLMCFDPIRPTIPTDEAFRHLLVNAVTCYCSAYDLSVYQEMMQSPLARMIKHYDHYAELSKSDPWYRKDCIEIVAFLDERQAAGTWSYFEILKKCVHQRSKVHIAAWALIHANALQLQIVNPWESNDLHELCFGKDSVDLSKYMPTLEEVFKTEQFQKIQSVWDYWNEQNATIIRMTLVSRDYADSLLATNHLSHPKTLLAFKDHSILFVVTVHLSRINYKIDRSSCYPLMLQGYVGNIKNIMVCKQCVPPGYQLCPACKDWHANDDFLQLQCCIHCIVANPHLRKENRENAQRRLSTQCHTQCQSACSGRTVDRKS